MECRDFCYWLQGYIEINGIDTMTPLQVQVIADHLSEVFTKMTPNRKLEVPQSTFFKPEPLDTTFIC